MAYRNPGIKLLAFYKSLLDSDESVPTCSFDISKILKASESFRKLEPIDEEWMAGWVTNWVAPLK